MAQHVLYELSVAIFNNSRKKLDIFVRSLVNAIKEINEESSVVKILFTKEEFALIVSEKKLKKLICYALELETEDLESIVQKPKFGNIFLGIDISEKKKYKHIIDSIVILLLIYDFTKASLPCSIYPKRKERDVLLRPGIDNPNERVWELPLKSRQHRQSKCHKCGKSAGMCIHDVVICYQCKKFFCMNCVGFNPMTFPQTILTRKREEVIQSWTNCPSCNAEFGAVCLPKMFLMHLNKKMEMSWEACADPVFEEINYCLDEVKKLAGGDESNKKSLVLLTRILACLYFLQDAFPGYFGFEEQVGAVHVLARKSRVLGEKNRSMYLEMVRNFQLPRFFNATNIQCLLFREDEIRSVIPNVMQMFDLQKVRGEKKQKKVSVVGMDGSVSEVVRDDADDGWSRMQFDTHNDPVFRKYCGVKRAIAQWNILTTGGTYTMFDLRWTFETAKYARVFVEKSLESMSEKHTLNGLHDLTMIQMKKKPKVIGEETQWFRFNRICSMKELQIAMGLKQESDRMVPSEKRKDIYRQKCFTYNVVYRMGHIVGKLYFSHNTVPQATSTQFNKESVKKMRDQVKVLLGMIEKKTKEEVKKFMESKPSTKFIRTEIEKLKVFKEKRSKVSKDCSNCGNRDSKKKCGRCMLSFYCSVECQRKHWKVHKKMCKRK